MNHLRVHRTIVGTLGCCAALALLAGSQTARAQAPAQPGSAPAASGSAPATASAPAEQPAEPEASALPPSAPPAVAPGVLPALHHTPVSTGVARAPLQLRAMIDNPHLVRKAWVSYRTPRDTEVKTALFQRASEGPYLGVIPADDVDAPYVGYCIEMETLDGKTIPVFASRQAMFRVAVPENLEDLRERAFAERLGGRRSLVQSSFEYVHFGNTDASVLNTSTNQLEQKGVADRYWRAEAGYTYRPLGIVSEFSIRAGAVRGQSVVPDETDEEKYQVGLNYASPMVRFRIVDTVHVEAELLTSVTEVGFSMGGGGALLLGDPYGTRLTFGFESIEIFGTRFYSKMDISAAHGITVAPIIEVTDMPHADRYGVRLLTDVQFDVGQGFRFGVRGGYQARTFTAGGPTVGTTLAYSF